MSYASQIKQYYAQSKYGDDRDDSFHGRGHWDEVGDEIPHKAQDCQNDDKLNQIHAHSLTGLV